MMINLVKIKSKMLHIVRVYNRANTRLLHLENGIEELKASICESSVMTEDEIQKDLDKLDIELHQYEKSFTDIKKNHSSILERCEAVITKSQNATYSTSILNPAIGNIVPQPLDGNAPSTKIKLTCNFQCNLDCYKLLLYL